MYSKRTPDYFSTDIDWKACDTIYPKGKQSYLNRFFPDGIESISFKARPSQSGVDCHVNSIPEPPITVDSGGWFDKVIKDWSSFAKNKTSFCDLKTSFSVNWISELLGKYNSIATKYRRSQRNNLWSKFVNDPDVLTTLSGDVPYISNKSIYCYLKLADESMKKRPKTHDNYDVNLFLSFLCTSIRSSPIVYFSLCNLAETGHKSFCYNDFCANNAEAMMNVFGEYNIKLSVKLERVFPTLIPFAHKVIPFLAVSYPKTIRLKKWDLKHINTILDLFLLYRVSDDITDGGKLRRLIIQFFMIMDNIHDFGKPRPPYQPANVCGDPRCITELLKKQLNTKLKEIGDFYATRGGKGLSLTPFNDADNFGQGFESSLLWQLIDTGRFGRFITVCPKTNNLANAMKNKNIPWTTDTTNLERKLIIALGGNKRKTRLNTAMFDGFVGSDPVDPGKDGKTDFTKMDTFYIPLTYSDGVVSYSTPTNDKMPKGALDRQFPVKYGYGGINMKKCTDSKTCFFRADAISNRAFVPANNVNDHVAQLGKIIGRIYKENGDPGFFFTLKSLGDFAQVMEAKERGIVLITQDSLEFLAGVLVGAMVIKANRFGKGWVLSQPLIEKLGGCGGGFVFGGSGGVAADTIGFGGGVAADTIGFGGGVAADTMDIEVDDGFIP